MSLKSLRGSYVPIGAYTPIGAMHSQVTFLNPATRADDGGQIPGTTFSDSWAKIAALVGRELYKAQETVQEVTHMVTVPYLAGLSEDMTILFEGRTFIIEAINDPDERHVEQRCLVREVNQNA
jgi:SPP1 family predicted phage head-tail adaptor